MESQIKVGVRVRPLLERRGDKLHYSNTPFDVNSNTNQIIIGNQNIFHFNYVVPHNCSQNQLFDLMVYPMINSVLEGHDVSIIMYGQSNTGKSYTLVGPGLHCAYSETEYGIIPRATRMIFNRLSQNPIKKFRITVSFIELTNEGIYDLLNTSYYKNEIVLSFNEKGSVILSGAEEIECQSISEVFNCLHAGMSNKEVASLNHQSYKSHTIFTIKIEQHYIIDGIRHYRYSKIQFTDLSGSERCYFNPNTGEIIQDPGLIALNNVINSLTDSYNQSFIPYSHSLITRFLKDSFGGKSLTLVICCISPNSFDLNETLNSLRFVEKVRTIKNYPRINSSLSVEENKKLISSINNQYIQNENNTNGDIFGLEFAASQWLKLVSNAENLFSKLVSSEYLEEHDKDKIQQWLCLKQECEECVVSDETISLKHYNGRILGRIEEELSESEYKSNPSQRSKSLKDDDEAESSHTKSESESDIEHFRPDFLDKLFDLVEKFKVKTDSKFDKAKDKFLAKTSIKNNSIKMPIVSDLVRETHTRSPPITTNLQRRRKSIYPGLENPYSLKQTNISPLTELISKNQSIEEFQSIINKEENLNETKSDTLYSLDKSVNTENILFSTLLNSQIHSSLVDENSVEKNEKMNEIKDQKYQIKTRHDDIKQLQNNLIEAHKRVEYLIYTIQIKEQFIEAMTEEVNTQAEVKEKLYNKHLKLQKLYNNTEMNIRKYSETFEQKEIEKYKKTLIQIDKQMKEIQDKIQTFNEKVKKISELKNSLEYSKNKRDKLKSYIQKEEKKKVLLEEKLFEDKKKMKELSKEYNLSNDIKNINQQKTDENGLYKTMMNFNKFQENDEKSTLREEIAKLRITKDFLVELTCNKKSSSKEKNLTEMDEHNLIEYDEAIGAIDAAIELKNELICDRKIDTLKLDNLENWKKIFLKCLISLKPIELSTLFWKYFEKVIDLRENGKKMESQLVEADFQNEIEIRALNNALEDLKFDNNKKIDFMHIKSEDKMRLIDKRDQFNDQSNRNSRTDDIHSLVQIEENDLKQMKRENQRLRKRLRNLEYIMHFNKINPQNNSSYQLSIPPEQIKTLKGISPPPTTKVTRQKNKLIIQQSSNKK